MTKVNAHDGAVVCQSFHHATLLVFSASNLDKTMELPNGKKGGVGHQCKKAASNRTKKHKQGVQNGTNKVKHQQKPVKKRCIVDGIETMKYKCFSADKVCCGEMLTADCFRISERQYLGQRNLQCIICIQKYEAQVRLNVNLAENPDYEIQRVVYRDGPLRIITRDDGTRVMQRGAKDCLLWLELEENFGMDSTKINTPSEGHSTICNSCEQIRLEERYLKNGESMREKARERRFSLVSSVGGYNDWYLLISFCPMPFLHGHLIWCHICIS